MAPLSRQNRSASPAGSDSSFEIVDNPHRQSALPAYHDHNHDHNIMSRHLPAAEPEAGTETLPAYEAVPSDIVSPAGGSPGATSPFVVSPPQSAVSAPRSDNPGSLYESAEQEKSRLRAQDAAAEETALRGSMAAPELTGPDESEIPVFASSDYPQENRDSLPTNVAALNRGLQIPSQTTLVSSGFPYPAAELAPYGVTAEDWARFTHDITSAARLQPSEWAVAIGSGAGTAVLAGIFIGWFALIPAIMVGHAAHRKQESNKLSDALYGSSSANRSGFSAAGAGPSSAGDAPVYTAGGDLEQKLLDWNQSFFAPRGLLIRLDLPGQRGDMDNMDVYKGAWVDKWLKKLEYKRERKLARHESSQARHAERAVAGTDDSCNRCNHSARRAERAQNRMERCVERMSRKEDRIEAKARRRAVKRGRIVVMPIRPADTAAASTSSPTNYKAYNDDDSVSNEKPSNGVIEVPIQGMSQLHMNEKR